jgi:uncharacterized protein YpmB
MSQQTFRILIGVVLVLFAVITIAFQSICAPNKNPVSAAVSAYVDKAITEPQAPKPMDPLSYDGIKRVLVRWVSQYCSN